MNSVDPSDLYKILEKWDLVEPEFTEIPSVVNKNWRITTNAMSYYLRQVAAWRVEYNPFIHQCLTYQFKMLHHLFTTREQKSLDILSSNFEIPRPQKTSSGKYLVEHNHHLYWLYPEIRGSSQYLLSADQLLSVTDVIINYHKQMLDLVDKMGKPPLSPDPGNLTLLKAKFSEVHELFADSTHPGYQFYERYIPELEEILETFHPSRFDQYLYLPLHRDLMPQNLLWDNSQLSGIIDFEHMTRRLSTPLEDIALFTLFSTGSLKSGNLDTTQHQLIFTRYETAFETMSLSYQDFLSYLRLIALEYILNYLSNVNHLDKIYSIDTVLDQVEKLRECVMSPPS